MYTILLCKNKMVKSTYTVRKEQIARIVQKELGMLLLSESTTLLSNAIVSVTAVDIASDASMAKVYLSFSLHATKADLFKRIVSKKNVIRKLLGKRIASKMHKIPDLKFYMDDAVIQGARVTALIDQFDAIEK